MSRRTGKAATRRARQQRRARQGPAPGAASAPQSANTPGEAAAPPAERPAPAPAAPTWSAYGGSSSRLGENAREEYHYVGRDLRNTAILTLIMAALLAGAVVLVNLSGIAPS